MGQAGDLRSVVAPYFMPEYRSPLTVLRSAGLQYPMSVYLSWRLIIMTVNWALLWLLASARAPYIHMDFYQPNGAEAGLLNYLRIPCNDHSKRRLALSS